MASNADADLFAAVRAGDDELVSALRWSGADVNAVDECGRTPLMLAAEAGAAGVVLTLLSASPHLWPRDGRGRSALDIALGGSDSGHIAGACVLEHACGIRTDFGELASRSGRIPIPDDYADESPDDYSTVVYVAGLRQDEEAFAHIADVLVTGNDRERRFAAEVLFRFGLDLDDEPFGERLVDLLTARARVEVVPGVLAPMLVALGEYAPWHPRALPDILAQAGHPSRGVRVAVAVGLLAEDIASVDAMLALSTDADPQVRRLATCGLASAADTPIVRHALAARLTDPDPDVVVEAARGLGLRDDPRADEPLMRSFLAHIRPDDAETSRAYEVMRHWPPERWVRVRARCTDPDHADGR